VANLNKKQIEAFKTKVQFACKELQEDRDKLRALLDEYADILQDADEAVEDMENAIDALSRLL